MKQNLKEFVKSGCNICGHESHCGGPLYKEFLDGDRQPVTIRVCNHCQCPECSQKDKENGI